MFVYAHIRICYHPYLMVSTGFCVLTFIFVFNSVKILSFFFYFFKGKLIFLNVAQKDSSFILLGIFCYHIIGQNHPLLLSV